MAYTALYRRFRPPVFKGMVGQEHIAKTLAHSVQKGTFVHAYLLCGPRGTGKTSTAKVLAKAVNCLDLQNGEPCCRCPACLRIGSGESMDVMEIDAASNRGIDEIRDLRERVKYAPAVEKHKVYIIDEVHMLTGEAFNALLKTLEEPPAHVIFILATTEPHKIPLTVLSRCQRFDFRRIGLNEMREHLKYISGQEGIKATEEALTMIAKKSEGGMRDAVNLLDQCSGFSEDTITEATVGSVLGCVDRSFVEAAAENILERDLGGILKAVEELAYSGKDFRQFVYDLLERFRELLLQALAGKNAVSSGRILKAIQALSEADNRLRYSLQPRITLELAMLDACGALTGAGEAPVQKKPPEKKRESPPKPQMVPQLCEDEPPLPEEPPLNKEENSLKPEALAQKKPDSKEAAELSPVRSGVSQKTKTADNPSEVKEGSDLPKSLLSLEAVQNRWPHFLNLLAKGENSATGIFLEMGIPAELDGNLLTLEFPRECKVHRDTIFNKGNHKSVVEGKLLQFYGKPLKIAARLVEDKSDGVSEQVSIFDSE